MYLLNTIDTNSHGPKCRIALILGSGVSDFFRDVLDHIILKQNANNAPKIYALGGQEDGECKSTLRTMVIGVNGVQ